MARRGAFLRRWWLVLGALVLLGYARPADALEITINGGEFDVAEGLGDGPYEAGLSVRLDDVKLFEWSRVSVVPAFGGMATEDETLFGWGGFAFRIPLGERWRLTPTLAVGAYEQGDGRNLGGTLEFRSGLEVAVRPSPRTAIGVEFYHLSNGGVHEVNPGSNSLVLAFGFTP
jgi:hypothetical protein